MGIARRWVLIAVAATVGWYAGRVAGSIGHIFTKPANYPFLTERVPLPHHVPQYAGGVSFRFAMAHDVIHERFARHGEDHYRERDRIARAKLRDLAPDDPAAFALADDIGVGLDRLGRSDEAVPVLRDKLARQQARGYTGRALYTSYANLGTFLVHANFKKAAAGEKSAREGYREGVALIRKSVEVNPEAHFGRERWQAAIAEFLLAAMDDPALLKTFDCLGNRLDLPIDAIVNRELNWTDTGYGRPYDPAFGQEKVDAEVPAFFAATGPLDDPSQWQTLSPIRRHITKVGAEAGWDRVAVPSHRSPAPFDEPVLGIIGMWRQGGGANPHFALALGETMLRVGQRYIAWAAFERASRLADRYSPDPSAREFLKAHCRKRQKEIEGTLAPHPRRADRLRAEFDAELAHGQGFQKDYQDYEAARIAAGASIGDAHFYDDWTRGKETIASRSGPEDWYARVLRRRIYRYQNERRDAWAALGAGLAALATATLLQLARELRSGHRGPLRGGVEGPEKG